MYVNASHDQETHRSHPEVGPESSCKRSTDMENNSSQPKEVYGKSVQKNDSGCTSSSIHNFTGKQKFSPAENDGYADKDSSTSAMPKELNVLFMRTEHVCGQSHPVNVSCHGDKSDGQNCVIEKMFGVEPADNRRKENSIRDAYVDNSKQQPAKKPNKMNNPSSNSLSAREVVNRTLKCNEHERIHTNAKPYTCEYCNKAFTRQDNLKVHERIHTGVKPYECSYCNKAFARHGSVKEHERTHTGVKPYKCSICNKDFAVESNLKVHERIHTGVKPYKCTICQKQFTVKCSLKKHESIHTGVKPYKCTYCGKAFAVMYSLKEHESVHTGDKPYKCTYCDKAFVRQVRLRKHERIHTGVKPYMCT